MFSECKHHGESLIAEGVIVPEDIKESRSGKGGSIIVSNGLPAYSILQALLVSAKRDSDGLILSKEAYCITLVLNEQRMLLSNRCIWLLRWLLFYR